MTQDGAPDRREPQGNPQTQPSTPRPGEAAAVASAPVPGSALAPKPAGPSPAVQKALELVEETGQAARAYDREDLAERLAGTRRLLQQQQILIYVVGEFKQGKSSLVNALLDVNVCPVDDDISTSVPTALQFSERPRAWATSDGSGSSGAPSSDEIPIQDLAGYVSESGNAGNTRGLRNVTVGVPRDLLAGGLVLVDTPGVGGLGSLNSAMTVTSLPRAHAMLLVSDASQELTLSELHFLRMAREFCPTNALVLTKSDLYPEWRRMLDLDLEHLRRDGVDVASVAVSSTLRQEAIRTKDHELDDESGFPALIGLLKRLEASAEQLALRSTAVELASAISQLETALKAERDVLANPERAAAITAELERARAKADEMRERSARWQQVLSDGFADISSEVDFDLRKRTRSVLEDAEEGIEKGDPGKNWEEFENWLRRRLSGETLDNYALLARSVKEVTAKVSEYLELAEEEITGPRQWDAPLDTISGLEAKTPTSTTKRQALGMGLVAVRGVYMGAMMAMMVGRIGGMMLPGPAGLAIGLLMGGSGLGGELKKRKEERRVKAKASLRRFMEEFTLQVSKDSRDALRIAQRELRDQCFDRVTELQRSTSEALSRAQQASQADGNKGGLERADADLARLASVGEQVQRLSGAGGPLG